MIIFIDIRNQGTNFRFSFWNSSTNRFVSIAGEYAWNSWVEFEELARSRGLVNLSIYRDVCPDWVEGIIIDN